MVREPRQRASMSRWAEWPGRHLPRALIGRLPVSSPSVQEEAGRGRRFCAKIYCYRMFGSAHVPSGCGRRGMATVGCRFLAGLTAGRCRGGGGHLYSIWAVVHHRARVSRKRWDLARWVRATAVTGSVLGSVSSRWGGPL